MVGFFSNIHRSISEVVNLQTTTGKCNSGEEVEADVPSVDPVESSQNASFYPLLLFWILSKTDVTSMNHAVDSSYSLFFLSFLHANIYTQRGDSFISIWLGLVSVLRVKSSSSALA